MGRHERKPGKHERKYARRSGTCNYTWGTCDVATAASTDGKPVPHACVNWDCGDLHDCDACRVTQASGR